MDMMVKLNFNVIVKIQMQHLAHCKHSYVWFHEDDDFIFWCDYTYKAFRLNI